MMTFFSLLPQAGSRLSTLAIELPRSITPAVAGLTVGLFVGVVGVIAVILLVGRGNRRDSRRARLTADEVVFIPPYGTMQRDTPLPPRAFAHGRDPGSSGNLPVARATAYAHAYAHAPNAHHTPVPGYGFRPSSALSARVLAKMGHADDGEQDFVDAPAVLVAPVVVLCAEKRAAETTTADKSAPHPLGIIKSTSAAMRPASFADLSFDDSPTEIGEPCFDDVSPPPPPARTRRRSDPPKIRPTTPAAPRFPEQTPRMCTSARARAPEVAATKNDRQHP
jgi:hypothetical protein